MLAFLVTILLCSCSNESEKEAQTGKIDAMTREIGQEAASMIQTPMDKAQAAADMETQRVREIDDRSNQ
jgi:hypothetical protein